MMKWLVSDWKQSPGWYSIKAAGLGQAMVAAWLILPKEFQQLILERVPVNWLIGVLGLVFVLVTIGRLTSQEAPNVAE